jgi:flagellar biosynthesis anti-sigma factor FlgM
VIRDLLTQLRVSQPLKKQLYSPIMKLGANSPFSLAMKVTDPNLTSLPTAANLSTAGTSRTQGIQQTGESNRAGGTSSGSATGDDVHLSELVRSLRSLAADSPERQARLEQIARTYASGAYKVDPQATASKIIDDAIES